jgi:hypothetical protein
MDRGQQASMAGKIQCATLITALLSIQGTQPLGVSLKANLIIFVTLGLADATLVPLLVASFLFRLFIHARIDNHAPDAPPAAL